MLLVVFEFEIIGHDPIAIDFKRNRKGIAYDKWLGIAD